jgi:hypothetical protein
VLQSPSMKASANPTSPRRSIFTTARLRCTSIAAATPGALPAEATLLPLGNLTSIAPLSSLQSQRDAIRVHKPRMGASARGDWATCVKDFFATSSPIVPR